MVEEGALRYVARILGHAGIPDYCCEDYFGLVLDELGRGVDDATELISRLRLAPSRLTNVDKPVGRFLLFGGPVARDFLDRTIEMLSDWTVRALGDPANYGLPLYVYQALDRYHRPDSVGGRGRGSDRVQAPRPTVVIDPWDPSGPFVALPPVASRLGAGSWRISSGDSTLEVRTSNLEQRAVTLPRSLAWNVDLIINGAVVRRSQFVGLGALNAVAFDSSGSLLRDPTRVSADSMRLLQPQDAELVAEPVDGHTRAVRIIEEFPTPTGDWSGFSFIEVDVSQLRRLIIRRAGADRSCWVSEPTLTPKLDSEPLDGITTINGLPVHSRVPDIRLPAGFDASLWRLRMTIGGQHHEVDIQSAAFGVVALTPAPLSEITEIDLIGRGPLGSDFAAHFVVIPGLSIERPRRVVLPGSSRPALTVRADPTIAIEGQQAGAPYVQGVRALGDRTNVRLADDRTELELAIGLPILLWSLATRDRRTDLDNQPIRAAAAEVVDDAAPLLKVRCGVEGIRLCAELECRGDVLYTTQTITTAPEGRWVFDLTPAKDALRLASTTVTVRLRLDGMPVTVGKLRQDPNVSEVDAQLASDGQLDVRWSEGRTVVDRVVRLWPLSRPWLGPTTVHVPNGATPAWAVDASDLPSGAYLVEVTIDDGWSSPRRPHVGSPSTVQVVIRGTGPQSDDALDVLAAAITTGRYSRIMTDDEIDQHSTELLQALESEITLGPDPTAEKSFRQTCEYLASRPLALEHALDDAVTRGVEADTYLALSIELARHIHPTNPAVATPSLWAVAPVIAARLDLAERDPEPLGRVETYLGISDLAAWQPDATPLDEKNMRVLMSLEAGQLRLLRTALDAVPVHLLDPETRQLAAFEWAINHQCGDLDADDWVGEYAAMIDQLALPEWATSFVAAERVGTSTARAFARARLPELVLRCAVLSVTTEEPLPRRALQRLRRHAPLIINRSLVLAATAQAQQGGVGDPIGRPGDVAEDLR
jgi:hypothetical protein